MKLEEISWISAKEYFENKDLVIIPVGSIENHGPHLCLGTDYIVPKYLVEMVEESVDVLFAPALPYGNADNHTNYSGTVTLGEEGLYVVIKAIVDSLYSHGARKIIFFNGHGGNVTALTRVLLDLNKKGGLGAILNWWQIIPTLNPDWAGGHAGAQETSAVMAINESYVNLSKVRDANLINLTEDMTSNNLNGIFYKGVNIQVPRTTDKVTVSGWAGPDHPKNSNVKWGNEMLEALSKYYIDFIKEFEKIKINK